MKKWILLILLLSACSENPKLNALSGENSQDAIVGGTLVESADPLSSKVLSFKIFKSPEITDEDDDGFQGYEVLQCTATALARRIILTAAHCIHTNKGSFSNVNVSTPKGIISFRVVKSIVHPDYDKEFNSVPDLALVVLERDLPKHIQIMELPEKRANLNLKTVTAAGFGKISGKDSVLAGMGVLRKTQLNVIGYLRSAPIFEVDQTQGKGICQGDSGGPALIEENGKTLVVGVVSKTVFFHDDAKEDDACNYRGVYVNVQYFTEWIKEVMNSIPIQ